MKLSVLDITFSKLVRERANWTCERCGKHYPDGEKRGLHCSHLWSRSLRSTRWDSFNAFAHCMGCHSYFEGRPVEFYEWAILRMGHGNFEAVRRRANTPVRLTKPLKSDLRAHLKAQLSRMEALRANGRAGMIPFVGSEGVFQ